jgi:hypothetical protein
LRLPSPVDQIDILIAHFGQAPTLTARGADKQVLTAVADDRPRQAVLLRLLGRGIDRVDIDAPGEAALVQIAFPGHTRGRTSSGSLKKDRQSPTRPGKKR